MKIGANGLYGSFRNQVGCKKDIKNIEAFEGGVSLIRSGGV